MACQENGIVVGVDGSSASIAALRWAIARARVERCPVTAVEVRSPEHYLPGTSYMLAPYGTAPPAQRRTRRLDATVAAVTATEPGSPAVTQIDVEGAPEIELVRIASNGTMLVLGHNPHGRLVEALLGRVASGCLRRATRPVVLVPVDQSVHESC
ncbi:hypothetical protein BLA60_15015 [Actinophytocola xinjiangensis]|uniref:UspA domain-containing protein n=1 Tax=Actinophytocola xinjiangensis TaxID=485602 RepID=A0A7Z0WMV6_9PSEU|nr:universal stress protein [Actinophytocola xinjiangensis]OLF10717.1 hypothetical protein BLA60_15015 [Actinophytocola xinjiangensis]